MRIALVALGVWAAAATGFGQSAPYLASVSGSDAKLRAGPSEQFPITAALKPGDPLWVDHEEDSGWLAVQDPPGRIHSVSWVSVQFVSGFDTSKPTPQHVTVEENTTLCPGSPGDAQPLSYFRRTQVPQGTILTVLGPKTTVDGKSWYPVLPPAGDYRYIPKQQVKADRTLNTSFTIREAAAAPAAIPPSANIPPAAVPAGANPPPAAVPAGANPPTPVPVGNPPPPAVPAGVMGPPVMPAPSSPSGTAPAATSSAAKPPTPAATPAPTDPSPPKPVVQNPLWAQAEAAEKDGRLDDAEKLYFQLARLMNEPGGDHDIANLCYTRIHALREKRRATPVPPGALRSTLSSPQTVGAPPPPAAPPPPPGDVEPIATGKLIRWPALRIDGRVTFALEISPGATIVYVVAGPGVDLERCVDKRVKVYGSSTTRKDLSKPLVVASSAEVTP